MYQDLPIQDIYAREILDSRGNPTVEVFLYPFFNDINSMVQR